jgi:hypothetical protein
VTHAEALELAQAELHKHGCLKQLPQDDRRAIEALASAVAARVAELVEGGPTDRPSLEPA